MNAVKLAALSFLLLTVILQFSFAPRYEFLGEGLLKNGSFGSGVTSWKVKKGKGRIEVADGVATFENKIPLSSTRLLRSFPAPSRGEGIHVQADIRTENVVGSLRPWQRARIFLVGRKIDGKKLWRGPFFSALVEGTSPWKRYSSVIPIPDQATGFVLGIGLDQSTGIMQVRNLKLHPVSERETFRVVSMTLLGLLIGVLLWISIPFFRSIAWSPARAGTGAVGALILVAVVLPGSFKRQALDYLGASAERGGRAHLTWLTDLSETFGGGLYQYLQQSPDKIGHFLFFAMLAGFSRRLWEHVGTGVITLYLLIFAVTTETLQFYAPGRTPSTADFGIDGGGIFLGLFVVAMARFLQGNPGKA